MRVIEQLEGGLQRGARWAGDFSPAGAGSLAISTHRLQKAFDGKWAVQGLTLDVRQGEIFGFLGPNGAGKSTSVKMLLGLIAPTAGEATVLGQPAGDRATRARIGFLPEHFRFYDWLTPAELLQLHGRLYGMPRTTLRTRVPELLASVGLTPHRDKQLRRFSKGMLQRIGLAQALLNEPNLLFLDEPTSGLDPIGRRLVRDLIKAQRERGATVFLNSHLLGEVEVTCDRVAFIKAGKVVEVRHMSSFSTNDHVLLRARHIADGTWNGIAPWATRVSSDGDRFLLSLRSLDCAPALLSYLVGHGAEIFEFTPQKLSLEQRFLEIIGEDQGL